MVESDQSVRYGARRYLMCAPTHFTVRYSINPWMDPARPTDGARAQQQWQTLVRAYRERGHQVEFIEPHPEYPDMVYAANGGFVLDGIAYVPRFRHVQRQGEAEHYARWFADHGFEVVEPTSVNEGEGDFLLAGEMILAGSGFRSDTRSHREVEEVFGRDVVSLTLVDPRFYHLDTALAVLDPTSPIGRGPLVAYLPSAFDERSQRVLCDRFPDAIRVSPEEAIAFALNAASDGRHVFVPPRAPRFHSELRARGYEPVPIDLSELLRGGGGIKCATLELREARPVTSAAVDPTEPITAPDIPAHQGELL